MRPPSDSPRRATRRLGLAVAALGIAALGLPATATPAAADAAAPSLVVVVDGGGATFTTTIEITCESPAPPAADGVELGSAMTTARQDVAVDPSGPAVRTIADLTLGTACSVTTTGPTAAHLGAVDGGTQLVGTDGRLRGVAVTVDRGTTAIADLTFTFPAAVASSVSRTESTSTTTAGSGSAATTPSPLPGGEGAASAATPVALAAARSTTTASSAALPETSGSGTTVVLASLGVLLCGAAAYTLVIQDTRRRRASR